MVISSYAPFLPCNDAFPSSMTSTIHMSSRYAKPRRRKGMQWRYYEYGYALRIWQQIYTRRTHIIPRNLKLTFVNWTMDCNVLGIYARALVTSANNFLKPSSTIAKSNITTHLLFCSSYLARRCHLANLNILL